MKRRSFLQGLLGTAAGLFGSVAAPVVAGTSKYQAGDPVIFFERKSREELAAMYPPKDIDGEFIGMTTPNRDDLVFLESTPIGGDDRFQTMFMKSRQSGMTERVWAELKETL